MKQRDNAYYHKSLISFKSSDYDVPIYRYIPFDNILHLLKSKELLVSQTKLWEDTYENFLVKAKHHWGFTPVSFHPFLAGFYGQCWTLLKETDALWRIYSNNKKGVRIKSRINKLLKASINEINISPNSTRIRIIGQVSYLTNNQIETWAQQQNNGFINDKILRESLLIKRKEFSHEKEVRLIIHKNIDKEYEVDGIEFPHIRLKIYPNELIEEITFDPRIRETDYETYSHVIKKMGFSNKVTKSKLYEFKPLNISWPAIKTKEH